MKVKLIMDNNSTTWINAYKHSNTVQQIPVYMLINQWVGLRTSLLFHLLLTKNDK